MARYAIIEGGVTANIVEAEEEFATAQGWVLAGNGGIGDMYENGEFVKPPEPMPTLEDYDKVLTAHLDAVAQSRRYDNRINCALRAGYAGPYQAEGIAFAQWMDAVNQMGYQMLGDFRAGNIPQPTIAEMLAALPVMVWPE